MYRYSAISPTLQQPQVCNDDALHMKLRDHVPQPGAQVAGLASAHKQGRVSYEYMSHTVITVTSSYVRVEASSNIWHANLA